MGDTLKVLGSRSFMMLKGFNFVLLGVNAVHIKLLLDAGESFSATCFMAMAASWACSINFSGEQSSFKLSYLRLAVKAEVETLVSSCMLFSFG